MLMTLRNRHCSGQRAQICWVRSERYGGSTRGGGVIQSDGKIFAFIWIERDGCGCEGLEKGRRDFAVNLDGCVERRPAECRA